MPRPRQIAREDAESGTCGVAHICQFEVVPRCTRRITQRRVISPPTRTSSGLPRGKDEEGLGQLTAPAMLRRATHRAEWLSAQYRPSRAQCELGKYLTSRDEDAAIAAVSDDNPARAFGSQLRTDA